MTSAIRAITTSVDATSGRPAKIAAVPALASNHPGVAPQSGGLAVAGFAGPWPSANEGSPRRVELVIRPRVPTPAIAPSKPAAPREPCAGTASGDAMDRGGVGGRYIQ